MLLNARFAALVVFCGVAVNPLCSNGTTGVHAAVIARDAQRDGVDNHSNDVDQKQTHFSSPWSHKTNHSSSKHKHRKDLERRSKQSLVVPNSDGHKYVVSHSRRGASTPLWSVTPGNNTSFNSTASADPGGMKNMTGTVELMSGNGQESKVVAYLMAGTYNNTQVLEATGNKSEASTMSLSSVSSDSSCSQSLGDNDLFVSLRKADSCATYNPTALYDQTMTLESCFAGSSLKSNKSQTFTYNQSTGKLTPVSCVGGDTSQKANSLPSSMDNSSNSTSTSSSSLPQTTSSSQRRRDSSAASSAQNVTLAFVPNATNNAVNIKEDSSTSTVTHTITSTVYSSAYSTLSSANVAAASVLATPSSSGVMASSTPSGKASGMNVELVGNGPSSSNVPSSSASNVGSSGFVKAAAASSVQAISSSVSGTISVAAVTASPSPTASVNATLIAASLASSYSVAARYSASNAASPSGSGSVFGVASASAMSSAQPAGQSVLVAAAWRREEAPMMAAVSTDPYTWKFSRE